MEGLAQTRNDVSSVRTIYLRLRDLMAHCQGGLEVPRFLAILVSFLA